MSSQSKIICINGAWCVATQNPGGSYDVIAGSFASREEAAKAWANGCKP